MDRLQKRVEIYPHHPRTKIHEHSRREAKKWRGGTGKERRSELSYQPERSGGRRSLGEGARGRG